MRISSLSFYNTSLTGLQDQQSNIARLTQQLATDKKYIATKDAPIETGRALQLADAIAQRTQHQNNQVKADIALKEEATVLSQLNTTITTTRSLVMSSTPSQDASTRRQVSTQLSTLYKQIKSLANYQDTTGNYMFAGSQTDTKPYAQNAQFEGAVGSQTTTYAGDAGTRQVEIDTGRYVQTNDNLDTVMKSGSANDLLQRIDQIATAIQNGTASQTDLNDATAVMTSALDSLQTMVADIAGRVSAVAEAKNTSKSLQLSEVDALGQIAGLDQAAAIVELQLRQVSLQAAESAFGLTSKQSLFNYL